MADLTPGQRRATQYWKSIEAVTLAGGSTQELWAAINAHAQALGYESAGISIFDVNALRSRAVANRGALQNLDALGPDDLITGPAIGRAPWERDLNRQNALPMWQVSFEHHIRVDGEDVTIWRSTMFQGSVPRTRRELELALDEDAERMADEYGQEHVGIGAYSILGT